MRFISPALGAVGIYFETPHRAPVDSRLMLMLMSDDRHHQRTHRDQSIHRRHAPARAVHRHHQTATDDVLFDQLGFLYLSLGCVSTRVWLLTWGCRTVHL